MGPTASGKSALGISIAKRCGGAILNADAMQCYRGLRIITARPSEQEVAQAPHYLYGMWSARTHGNVALWQAAAVAQIQACHDAGQVPILLGGTGMYIKGLTEGLSPVPPISEEVKRQVAALSCRLHDGIRTPSCDGVTKLYEALQCYDPRIAKKLDAGDSQRIARALEVVLETGKSLLDWQAESAPAPFAAKQCHFAYLDIDRETLYPRINARFDAMMEAGALEEVRALKAYFNDDEIAQKRFPILKSHGVPELMAYLDGQMALEDALEKGKQNTRNYAKRQLTWLRGQVSGAQPLAPNASGAEIDAWLQSCTLT